MCLSVESCWSVCVCLSVCLFVVVFHSRACACLHVCVCVCPLAGFVFVLMCPDPQLISSLCVCVSLSLLSFSLSFSICVSWVLWPSQILVFFSCSFFYSLFCHIPPLLALNLPHWVHSLCVLFQNYPDAEDFQGVGLTYIAACKGHARVLRCLVNNGSRKDWLKVDIDCFDVLMHTNAFYVLIEL